MLRCPWCLGNSHDGTLHISMRLERHHDDTFLSRTCRKTTRTHQHRRQCRRHSQGAAVSFQSRTRSMQSFDSGLRSSAGDTTRTLLVLLMIDSFQGCKGDTQRCLNLVVSNPKDTDGISLVTWFHSETVQEDKMCKSSQQILRCTSRTVHSLV